MSLLRTSARGLAWTVGRMLAVVVVGAVLAYCGVGESHAQSSPPYTCTTNQGPCNREEAYQQCMAHAAYNQSQVGRPTDCNDVNVTSRQYTCYRRLANGASQTCSPNYIFRWAAQECPSDTAWNDETKQCEGNPCASKPDLTDYYRVKGDGGQICLDGCSYTRSLDVSAGAVAWTLGEGSQRSFVTNRWASDGTQCTAAPPEQYDPDSPFCQSIGSGWMQCMQKDGRQCAIKDGARFCWNPGETGPRQVQDGSKSANRQPQGQPNTPPPDQTEPQQQGQGQSSVNNNFYTTNVYAGSGTTGGQSNTGEGGTDPTAGGGSGSGNGDGTGDGEGEGNSASGGSCASGWVCGGDPVACAILKEEHMQRCAAEKERSDIAGADNSWDAPPVESIFGTEDGDVNLDSSGWWGGGGDCPLLTGAVADSELASMFSEHVCPLISMWAAIMLAGAYIHAAYIIGRAVTGGS